MGNTTKHIGVYVRISSDSQNHDGQKADLQRWLDRSGIKPEAVEWFIDTKSGKTLLRPAFDRMQARIFSGDIRTVVVWKLDRLARNLRDGINVLVDWARRDVRVVSVTQQIDVSGVLGQTVAAVLLGFAELETQYRAERQRVGIAAAKRRGVYKGRQPGTTKAEPERAKALAKQGLTYPEIATALGCSVRTVARYLSV